MPQNIITSHFFRILFNVLLAVLAFTIILLLAMPIGFYGMAMYLNPTLPSVAEIKTPKFEMPLQIYSQDNKLIGQYGNRLALPTRYNEVPDTLVKAFLAAEDVSFFEHSGISIKGLGRAITEALTDDENQTGGSTITMQVAKNYFLTPDRTINRKLTELYLSRRIEDELTKDEILTLYVNKIYLGEGAYGIKAGAKRYYSKSLDELTIAEMAMLAGLPKAPSQNNPVSNPQRALARRNWILGQMLTNNYITDSEYKTAVNAPIGLNLYNAKPDIDMPYLAEMARYTLVNHYGRDVMNSGWRVRLTVDSEDQLQAEQALRNGLIAYDRRHGWRGAEANGEPLSNFSVYGGMIPAKVTRIERRSFDARLATGETITVPWSGMRWARKYYSTNRIGGSPSNASQIVKIDDIVRVSKTDDGESWKLLQLPAVEGSLVSIDPDTGALIALVGGFDFNKSKFNRATQGWRQPGSTIKPLIYTAALEKGYSPDSIVEDSPIQVGSWKPKNSDGRFYGPMQLRKGLYLSRNLVSIRLLQAVGTADARHLLDQFGLDKDQLPPYLSLALGAGQATPLQMATAYSTFANGGHRIQPYFIDQIYTYDNKLIYQANPRQACATCFNDKLEDTNKKLAQEFAEQTALKQNTDTQTLSSENNDATDGEAMINEVFGDVVDESSLKPALRQYVQAEQAPRIISANSAYQMADILRDVIQLGTGRRARALNRSDIGGKTGTTNEARDAWFAGFQPTIATVVWVGFDQPQPLGRREYGGVAALPIWIEFMGKQLQDRPVQWLSLDNKAKSEKQETRVISITEEGVIDSAKTDTSAPDADISIPLVAEAQERPPAPAPSPEPDSVESDLVEPDMVDTVVANTAAPNE